MTKDLTRADIEKISNDIENIKNDLNVVKANTQISANLLSILHGQDIADIVFSVANTEKLCKALMICSESKTAKQLCDALQVKPSNIRKQIIDKLLNASFLTVVDKRGQSEMYRRAMFLDMIGFDKLATAKYTSLRDIK